MPADAEPPKDSEFVALIRQRFQAEHVEDDLLSALEQFSGPMLTELSDRLSMIENKAVSVMGWSSALLAFMLLQPVSSHRSTMAGAAVLVAAAAATAAAVTAAMAVRPRGYEWPTVKHWFCEELFDAPDRLRALHLIELLAGYEHHCEVANNKSWWLVRCQWGLMTAAVLTAVAVFLGFF